MSEEIMEEYVVFTDTTKDGKVIEMAVVDEFEYEKKEYIVSAVVAGEEIVGDDLFIYRVKPGKDFAVERITAPGEYEKIAEAYGELEKMA